MPIPVATGGLGGFSFDPAQAQSGQGGGPSAGGAFRTSSPNADVNVLSLRLPKVQAPNSVVPLPLLTSQGSASAGAVDPQFMHLLATIVPNLRSFAGSPSGGDGQPPQSGRSFSGGSPSVGGGQQTQSAPAPGLYGPAAPAPSGGGGVPTSPVTSSAPSQQYAPFSFGDFLQQLPRGTSYFGANFSPSAVAEPLSSYDFFRSVQPATQMPHFTVQNPSGSVPALPGIPQAGGTFNA